MKIASKQKQELGFLRDTLKNLTSVIDRKSRGDLAGLQERLDTWAAKVAVIGQVKAGKSTFLNAMLRQHDFLPSDVNPWTSVVTNIRINVPSDPPLGACFEFFAEEDWEEIIAGGSKIRKLTEQLLPGFDTEVLKQQSEMMRERAQRRLGKYYRTLLGSKHEYDFLSPDLLARYVCAGPGADDGLERESLGRYASLTKVANVYTRMPEFQVPTIITDTPGVNDPFLVRDEFTCRSLDKSDVFVVVLSAHQPLTDVDIALIRILAKQDEKDVLIFVNRIDELDDYDVEVPRVMKDVSRRLKEAIPDIAFKIVAGSAWMADLAMQDGPEAEEARNAIDTRELHDYLKARHGEVPEDQIDRLLLASGLDEVRKAIGDIIDSGVGSRQLEQLLGDIRAEMNATQFVAKRERDSLQMQVESVNSEIAAAAAEELAEEITSIGNMRDRLQTHVDDAESKIEKVVGKSWIALEEKLLEQIDAFCDDQKPVLEEMVSGGGSAANKTVEINITPLLVDMEREVARSYDRARAATDVTLNNCLHACRQSIRDRFEDPTENINLDELPYDTFTSTLTLAKKSLQIGAIVDRGWAFWRKPKLNVEKTLDALRTIAAEDMRPAVEKILTVFNEAQVDRASAGTSRIRVMLRMIEVSLAERTHRLKQDKAELEKVATDPEARRQMVHRLQSKMEVLEYRLQNLAALDSSLERPVKTQDAA